jgi:citrate synthase
MRQADVMTAEQAAAELGVALRTVYSYVSRKGIRTVAAEGDGKRRLYSAEDIRKLKSSARLTGVIAPRATLVDKSVITEVTEAGPFYRGRSAIELSETETLETVGELLLDAPGVFSQPPPHIPEHIRPVLEATKGLSVADQAISSFPLLEQVNPRAYDLSPGGFARTTVDVARYYAALLVGAEQPSDEPIHSFIARSRNADPALEDIVRRTLVLLADHDLDPTTYAVRALANTGATPFLAAITGMSAFRGHRLQFGRSELVNRLVEEVVRSPDPSAPVVRSFRHGDPMLGFGSIVYGDHDPRADTLLAEVNRQMGDDPEVRALNEAIRVGKDLMGSGPSVTLMLAFIRHRLGLPVSDVSFMAAGRIVGWCAHALEQYHSRELYRPRSL